MANNTAESDAPTLPAIGGAPTLPSDPTHVISGAATSPDARQAPADSAPPPVDPAPAPLDVDAFDDRYRVRALLGAGGMGEVHLGRDERIGREVAIKIARGRSGSQADAVARFVREARVQGQLEHPSIVPVYDMGRRPDGAIFFTMKRVRGLSLEQILAGLRAGDADLAARYSPRKLLTAFSNVCLAVHFAHTRGVLHRDLKPANVMFGDFGEVYVLDWGLAKVAGADAEAESVADSGPSPSTPPPTSTPGMTEAGAVMGTPGYMPPEQARGHVDVVDPRVDVYSLGAVFFEMLTLVPLHPHGPAEAIASTINGADARACARAPDRDIAPELEVICVRATATDPAARFPTARELHEAIERYLDGDRDLSRRRELADGHAGAADQAAGRALAAGGTDDDRREALKQAGRALALDPGNAGATRTMVRLLVTPPAALPNEVKRELDDAWLNGLHVAARTAGLGFFSVVTAIPAFLWMGIKRPELAYPMPLLGGLIGLCSVILPRFGSPARWRPLIMLIALVMCLATIPVTGTYLLFPGFLTATVAGFTLSARRDRLIWPLAAGLVTLAAGMIAEWAGLFAPITRFVGGVMTIESPAVHLPQLPTTLFLALTFVGMVGWPAYMIFRMRKQLDRAEERLVLQSWQLRQLVPDEAHGALATPAPPAPAGCVLGS